MIAEDIHAYHKIQSLPILAKLNDASDYFQAKTASTTEQGFYLSTRRIGQGYFITTVCKHACNGGSVDLMAPVIM